LLMARNTFNTAAKLDTEAVDVSNPDSWKNLVQTSILDGAEGVDLEAIEDPEVRRLVAAYETKYRMLLRENEVFRTRNDTAKKANETLKKQVHEDALTKVWNRRYFNKKVKEEVSRALRYKRSLSVLFIDADHFKRINDADGHDIGDQVLRSIARILKGKVRDVDSVCRYGGEEFVIILPDTTPEQALILAKRISKAVREAILARKKDKSPIRNTISIGISGINGKEVWGRPSDVVKNMVVDADTNMYKLKGEKQFKGQGDYRGKIAMGLEVIEP